MAGALRQVLAARAESDITTIRLLAAQIEDLTVKNLYDVFTCSGRVQSLFNDLDVNELPNLETTSAHIANSIKQDRHCVRQFISRIEIGSDNLSINMNVAQIADAFNLASERINTSQLTLHVPFTKRRRGNETKLVTRNSESSPDKTLIKTLAASHRWLAMLKQNIPFEKIAEREGRSISYIRTRLPLALLSPKIQTAILNGKQPIELTAGKLARMIIPMAFDEQEQVLGFGS
jgi:hypothetical protein